ncbi:glycine oxidase ThiO [Priestia megaterium]|uniref:glycine oxidase ThiO n=1 Tax=Priestia megaterium TaxID=1404 RepID=UPI00207A5B41|nr:glycine oxidase ThiO [Priestia megaterium]USL43024.1 glycine oxidase ThiO [Priestia megaterium]
MKQHYDVLLIGGGIISSSIAYHLSKQGASVAILERNQIGCEASSAAAGILGAQAEIDEEGPLLDLAIKSRSMFPELVKELKEKTAIDVELIQKGLLKVAVTEEDAHVLKKKAAQHHRWDEHVRWIDVKEARLLEPGLSPDIYGAITIPGDGQLAPAKLTQALAHGALYHGADVFEYCDAHSLIMENETVKGVQTSKGSFYGEKVVIAAGSWAKRFISSEHLGQVFPVKGECIALQSHKPLLSKTIFLDEGFYLVPKTGGRIVIGATKLQHDFTKTVSAQGIQFLLNKASVLLPAIKEATFEKAWAGLRPQTNDGWPYLGEHPEIANLHMAFGHYRNGILLSAATGKIMADALLGKKPNHSFFTSFQLTRVMEGVH